MSSLDRRKIKILEAIVHDYVTTTKPVGSERLIEIYQIGCKSATVRNEMAEMAEMGYLLQPHTSAGRIPSDRGYRYYVDELMNPPSALKPDEANHARKRYGKTHAAIEEILQQTCRILSEMTSYTSVATDPSTAGTSLRRVYLTSASSRHLLLVLLLSTGHVEHRLVEIESVPPENTLTMLSNYVNSQVMNRDLEELGRLTGLLDVTPEFQAYAATLSKIWPVIKQVAIALTERRVFMEGTNQLLRQPEFHDVQRLEMLLAVLEQHNILYRVLSRALRDSPATIIIGGENDFLGMKECSVITTPYRIGDRQAGYLGVVGPTRMNYDRAVAAVGLMAQSLSQMLTHLSLS
jgi:heat-inducible transcriptional repressor